MPSVSKNDIAISSNGNFGLSVCDKSNKPDIRGIARLFNLVDKRQTAEFEVRHECPGWGTRIALNHKASSCFVGCYNVYGIACYSLPEGKEIWRRKDLISVQRVLSLDFQKFVFVSREKGASHLLDAGSGKTVEKLSGVEKVFGSPFDETIIINRRGSLELHRPFGKKLWSMKQAEKFVGFIYYTPARFLIVERGQIQCFDKSSQELIWSLSASVNLFSNNRIVFIPKDRCFQLFQIENDGPVIICLDEKSGQTTKKTKLPKDVFGDLCLGGKALFDSKLRLRSAETGALLNDFATDAMLACDPQYKHQLLKSLADNSMSLVELEKYMKTEGFSEQEIKKTLFLKAWKEEQDRRKKE